MVKKLLACALASSALIPATVAGQVLSGLPGGNPGQGGPPSLQRPESTSGPGGFGAFAKGNMSDMDSDIRNNDRHNSAGEGSSAATRIGDFSKAGLSASTARALNGMFPGTRATTKVTSGSLAGLKAGMMLWSNGSPVGVVPKMARFPSSSSRMPTAASTVFRRRSSPSATVDCQRRCGRRAPTQPRTRRWA